MVTSTADNQPLLEQRHSCPLSQLLSESQLTSKRIKALLNRLIETWSHIMILDNVPRVRFLEQPTPLERLSRIETLTGHHSLWIKRDDNAPLGQGGNKVRSLEFWMGEATAQASDIILVAGKTVSNNCRLAAAAAAKLGIECLILHNDDEPSHLGGNHLLSHLFGASFQYLGPIGEEERAIKVQETAERLRREGRRPYIVGDEVTGAFGYVMGALELHQQAYEKQIGLRHVLLPGSMGTTEAGFLFGCALLGGPFTVHLVSVEYEVEELKSRVATIFQNIGQRTGLRPASNYLSWTQFYGEYLGHGYDQSTPDSLAAIRAFGSQEGLLLENTYTSKPAAALLDLTSRGMLPPDEATCLLHTGGIPALFAQAGLIA
jgi:1-aminocyclopropane-1-carboxylate deaminase/D-cysteine desulfhydrase-like pyridoxal-dependent ACC family enzyme